MDSELISTLPYFLILKMESNGRHITFLQYNLLEHSWRELFLLSLAQWDVPLDTQSLLDCAGVKYDQSDENLASTVDEINQLRATMERFRILAVDRTEYTCLKAIILFKPGSTLY